MKRKNKFILIGLIILIIFIFLIYKLLNLQSSISEKHIGIKFEIHNCSSVEKNSAELRENFLKPLLEFNTVQSKTETTENLYLPSVKCIDKTFCIPAIGINAMRYNSKTETLQESTMTSTSREGDQEAFFSNWNGGDNLSALEQNLLKSNPKAQQNPSLNEIKKIDKLDLIFIDSFIIDKNCSDQVIEDNKPYIYRSTRDLRNYINKQLEKNPNAVEKGTINKTIHIFTYCGAGIAPVAIKPLNVEEHNDTDKDGIIDKIDQCDSIPGPKECVGCPCKPKPQGCESDKDKDGICDDEDRCPNDFGFLRYKGCPITDKDRDGIPDDEDRCPNDFGFLRYKGCPIPDKDGDGVNDEIDKCIEEKGTIANNGCPLTINISHNNSSGRFTVSGIDNIKSYNVYLLIKEVNGKIVEHKFSGHVCPYKEEANKIISLLSNPVDLRITVIVKDNSGIELKSETFKNLSMICFSDKSCGFVNLDKIR